MISVDTNILVRILVDDPQQSSQVHSARRYVKQAEQVYVPQIVQVEMVWVLESAYRLTREQVGHLLEHLGRNTSFFLQNELNYRVALNAYKTKRADFADYLIWAESQAAGHSLLTFDKKLGREKDVICIS